MYNFLNTCLNGESDESINIHVKCKCRWICRLLDSKTKQENYEGLMLLGVLGF